MLYYVIALVLTVVDCRFVITSPQQVADQYLKSEIPYSMANFGHFPYGRTSTGMLVLPTLGQATNYDLCDPFPQLQPMNSQPTLGSLQSWYIANRGNCTFTRKAKNAQSSGANMLIIVDNVEEFSQQIIMGDDGNGYLVTIPTIFIGKKDGQKLIEAVQKREQRSGMDGQTVLGLITFNDTKKQTTPFVLLGLSLENRQTFKLLADLKPYYSQLKNYVNFNIFFELIPCYLCHFKDYKEEELNCLGGGRYCSLDPDGSGVGNGQNILYETLRQYCLFQLQPDLWWDYMVLQKINLNKITFDQECLVAQEYGDCSKRILKNETLQQQIGHCVVSSFNESSENQKLATNKVMDQWVNYRSTTGILYYPGLTVNNVTHRGGLFADDIVSEICSGMTVPAPVCEKPMINPLKPVHHQKDAQYVWLIVVVIVSCIVFALFIFCIYRRILRRQLSHEMGAQVNQMVSQYIQFYESKSTGTS